MTSIEKMVDFAMSKWHKVGYSMGKRLGPDFYDCSSFVYYALISGGFLDKSTRIGTTEDLYKLNGSVLKEIKSYANIRKGDIFIRGREGYSLGANGHTGIFLRKDEIIHCNATNDTVSINNEFSYIDYYLDRKSSDYERYFRPIVSKNNIPKEKSSSGWVKTLYPMNVRENCSTSSQIVASYSKGEWIYYDKIVKNDGHLWISYIGYSKKRRYVALKEINGMSFLSLS